MYKITINFVFSIFRAKIRNKGPTGPHVVHLSRVCHLFDGSAWAAIFVYWSAKPHGFGRGRWDIAFWQVLLNSVQRYQRRSLKCISQSQAGRLSYFSNRSEKHKLCSGRWDLATCQVSLNSVQRRSRKCLSQSEAAAILFFWSVRETQTWKRTLRSCFLSKFRWISFSGFRGEVENGRRTTNNAWSQ